MATQASSQLALHESQGILAILATVALVRGGIATIATVGIWKDQ